MTAPIAKRPLLSSLSVAALLVNAPGFAQEVPVAPEAPPGVASNPDRPGHPAGQAPLTQPAIDTGSIIAQNTNSPSGTNSPSATEIIRSLAPMADQPSRELRDVDGDVGGQQRRWRVDYGHAIDLTVFFDYDSAQLTGQAKVQLEPLGRALQSRDLLPYRFLVAGHTDAAGDPHHNRVLSLQRALAVRGHLINEYGIDPLRLVVAGFGATRLKDHQDPYSNVNRRVEVALIAGPPSTSSSSFLQDDCFCRKNAFESNPHPVRRSTTITVENGRAIVTRDHDDFDPTAVVVRHAPMPAYAWPMPAYAWRSHCRLNWYNDPRSRVELDLDDFGSAPTDLCDVDP
jgi:outer membrane protein OmpA-like peptidoglycan-associated protein